jgi:predicted nucleic acid-binding Zn finger protein
MEEGKGEIEVIEKICSDIRSAGGVAKKRKLKLAASLSERFENAMNLVRKKCVKKYIFNPSGRVLWIVKGRKAEYQVIPDANFCNCNDYYFRVINREKQLCYHIIAQKLAEALNKYEVIELPDRNYGDVTKKWKIEEKEAYSS